MKMPKNLFPILLSSTLLACSSSNDSKDEVVTPAPSTTTPDTMKPDTMKPDTATPGTMKAVDKEPPAAPAAPTLSLSFTPTQAFSFSWEAVPGATSYQLKEAVTNGSGYTLVKETAATSFDHVVLLFTRLNAKYILESCNAGGCTTSAEVFTSTSIADLVSNIDYLKATNTDAGDYFGSSVSLSADGSTLVVGAYHEASSSLVINEGQDDDTAGSTGAVYVFTRNNTSAAWSPQAYLKAENAGAEDEFGKSVSLSDDGNTLVVGAHLEDGTGTNSGAAYVFTRNANEEWSQQVQLSASNAEAGDFFGSSVSISADGSTIAVGALQEDSGATTINGPEGPEGSEDNADRVFSGAVYVFARTGEGSNTTWPQQAYLKALNAGQSDRLGSAISLSKDGNTLAVGAEDEDSGETGVGGNGNNNDLTASGAVYVFIRDTSPTPPMWSQQAYLKASNTGAADAFGNSVSISADGNTLAVGAWGEKSNAKGINGTKGNDLASGSGAAYVFIREVAAWSEQAYLKASNTEASDNFGYSVSISANGNTLAVGASNEDSDAVGINRTQTNNNASNSGAVYTYTRSAATWSQQAYLKANNTAEDSQFGSSVALSADGGTLVVAATQEDSNTIGVNPDSTDGVALESGAVYVY